MYVILLNSCEYSELCLDRTSVGLILCLQKTDIRFMQVRLIRISYSNIWTLFNDQFIVQDSVLQEGSASLPVPLISTLYY